MSLTLSMWKILYCFSLEQLQKYVILFIINPKLVSATHCLQASVNLVQAEERYGGLYGIG